MLPIKKNHAQKFLNLDYKAISKISKILLKRKILCWFWTLKLEKHKIKCLQIPFIFKSTKIKFIMGTKPASLKIVKC